MAARKRIGRKGPARSRPAKKTATRSRSTKKRQSQVRQITAAEWDLVEEVLSGNRGGLAMARLVDDVLLERAPRKALERWRAALEALWAAEVQLAEAVKDIPAQLLDDRGGRTVSEWRSIWRAKHGIVDERPGDARTESDDDTDDEGDTDDEDEDEFEDDDGAI